MNDVKPESKFTVEYPFYLGIHHDYDINIGPTENETWVPGCRSQDVYPDDSEFVADGVGSMILTVVSTHKPSKYPERVFYTRKWISPDGDEFGSSKLHIITMQTFKRRAARYYHDYRTI